MKPDEALYLMENYGGLGVPRIYSEMPRGTLQKLVDECARISGAERSEAGLMAWAQQRLKQPNLQGIADKKLGIAPSKPGGEAEAEAAPSPVEAVPEEPKLLSHRAILRPERLSTPRRRQAAFLVHFARCRTVLEAATRTGVDRRTVQRWRKENPLFDRKCRDIVETRRRQAVENIVLAADHVEIRPIFYRGKKVGEYTRRDRALDLYLLKQADAAARQEEKREDEKREAQQREETQKAPQEDRHRDAEADFEARVAAAVERAVEREAARRISEMSHFSRQGTAPQDDEFTNVFKDVDPDACDMALAR